MTIRELYILTHDHQPIEIYSLDRNLYIGASCDIPSELFNLIVERISCNSMAIVVKV